MGGEEVGRPAVMVLELMQGKDDSDDDDHDNHHREALVDQVLYEMPGILCLQVGACYIHN